MSGNNNNNSIKLSCLDRVKRNTDGKRPETEKLVKFVVWAADKSGSMYSLMQSLREGYKNFIEEQQEESTGDSETGVLLTTITSTGSSPSPTTVIPSSLPWLACKTYVPFI